MEIALGCDAMAVHDGFTSYTGVQLRDQCSDWVADGITRIKMKIGRHPDEDLHRVSVLHQAIGPEAELFVVANGAYSRKQALALAQELRAYNVRWFEEPVSSDDLEGLRLLRDQVPTGIDITAGEYGLTGCKCWESLQARESAEANRDTRGQDLNRAQTSKRGDPPHHCAIVWLAISHLFPCTRLTSDAVALSLSRVEPHLRYGKLATSKDLMPSFAGEIWPFLEVFPDAIRSEKAPHRLFVEMLDGRWL